MALTPAPASNIEWNKLGLAVDDIVNGHVESHYDVATGEWSQPKFIKDPYIKVHGLSPALNYGMQAYEGLKACRSPSGSINIFRPSFHAKRLSSSAACVSMPAPSEELFTACVNKAVALNAEFVAPHSTNGILYIRPVLFGSGPQLALQPPKTFVFAVYVQPATTYHGLGPLDCLVMEDFDRAAPKGTGAAKVGGNYAPVMRWSKVAAAKGYFMTLHLDSATQTDIEEFSTSGFIGVKKSTSESGDEKVTLVIPDSNNVIDSVTSNSCLQLAENMGWTVEKRRVPFTELPSFQEILAVGTAASIVPIKSITRESTGHKFNYCLNGEPGACGQKLAQALGNIMKGNVEDKLGWLYEVRGFPEKSIAPPVHTLAPVMGKSLLSELLQFLLRLPSARR